MLEHTLNLYSTGSEDVIRGAADKTLSEPASDFARRWFCRQTLRYWDLLDFRSRGEVWRDNAQTMPTPLSASQGLLSNMHFATMEAAGFFGLPTTAVRDGASQLPRSIRRGNWGLTLGGHSEEVTRPRREPGTGS